MTRGRKGLTVINQRALICTVNLNLEHVAHLLFLKKESCFVFLMHVKINAKGNFSNNYQTLAYSLKL